MFRQACIQQRKRGISGHVLEIALVMAFSSSVTMTIFLEYAISGISSATREKKKL
jgi:hypothetical protein